MRIARAVSIAFVVLLFCMAAVPASAVGVDSRLARLLGCWFCRIMLRLIGVRIRLSGATPERGRSRLVVANHVSWLDPLVFGAVEPLCPLAKLEVASWPAISSFARLQGAVFVDRARRMQIPRVNREMAARLAEGRSLLFFPEGTTFDGTRRGRFLTSHLACLAIPGATEHPVSTARVQAVAVAYSDPAAAWVGDATLLPHLWLLLGLRGFTCTLSYGAVDQVEPGFNRKVLGAQLAQQIELLLAASRGGKPVPSVPDAVAA